MNSSIQVLKQAELCGRQFDVYGTPEEPLFIAKEVAEVLELTNVSDMVSRVDNGEVTKFNLGSRQGETWFLTEDGLYEVLMQSRKPIAKDFKKGVKEILKSIRKHGAYATTTTIDSIIANPENGIKLLQALQKEREEKAILESRNGVLSETIEIQSKELKAQAPKVDYYDHVLDSTGLQTVNMIASCFGISPIKLNKLLCQWGIQYKQSGTYFLYAKYRDKGYAEHKPYPYIDSKGETKTRQHMFWTEKGKQFIIELYTDKAKAERARKALNEQKLEQSKEREAIR